MVVVVNAVTTTTSTTIKPCPQACTYEYRPICGESGSDRKTFANPCDLDFHNCQNNASYVQNTIVVIASSSVILKSVQFHLINMKFYILVAIVLLMSLHTEAKSKKCDEKCEQVHSPVCAYDGKVRMTFGNNSKCLQGNRALHKENKMV
ncbi:hypothetical protein C0J52_25822 [Blattella germanica]|nr:hypothetical protein C0J52_25822 [Blattella germanica]